MSKADRIARAKVEADRRKAAESSERTAAQTRANAAAELRTIKSLSQEVLTLLEARGYEDPEPEPLTLRVERVPILGEFFGHRQIVKGGWKIAGWEWDREKPPHQVWLLADGRYCWNGRIVSISEFSDWHERRPLDEGRKRMIDGLKALKDNARRTA